jgi:uncharacterized protein Smg (DUF494 family)
MKASIPLISAGGEPVGLSKKSDWDELQKMLIDAGFQKSEIDTGKAFTNELLSK